MKKALRVGKKFRNHIRLNRVRQNERSKFRKRMTSRNMDEKHGNWPLSMRVIAMTKKGRFHKGKISSHLMEYKTGCWVDFGVLLAGRRSHMVRFDDMKPIGRRPVNPIPWYKRTELRRRMA